MTSTVATTETNRLFTPRKHTVRLAFGSAVIVLFILTALAGPYLYGFDPRSTDILSRLKPPLSLLSDGRIAYLGTDELGRDILGQMIYGARVSLAIAVGTVVGAGVVGSALGIVSGYLRGPLDATVMRLADIQLAIPPIVLAIMIVGVLGPGIPQLTLALAFTRWVMFARVARSATLVAREQTFVEAARVAGLRDWQIMAAHILPSVTGPVLVIATLQLGLVILAEASLSFLGLGTTPLEPTWGSIISHGRGLVDVAWWISVMPGLALSMIVVAFAMVGDALRARA
jgi:peptide/nickel transport system permease protein